MRRKLKKDPPSVFDRFGVRRDTQNIFVEDIVAILAAIRQGRLDRNSARRWYGLTEEQLTDYTSVFAGSGEKGLERYYRRDPRPRDVTLTVRPGDRRPQSRARTLHGVVTCIDDLPRPRSSYTLLRKRAIVRAIESGVKAMVIDLAEALQRYGLTPAEYGQWKERTETESPVRDRLEREERARHAIKNRN